MSALVTISTHTDSLPVAEVSALDGFTPVRVADEVEAMARRVSPLDQDEAESLRYFLTEFLAPRRFEVLRRARQPLAVQLPSGAVVRVAAGARS